MGGAYPLVRVHGWLVGWVKGLGAGLFGGVGVVACLVCAWVRVTGKQARRGGGDAAGCVGLPAASSSMTTRHDSRAGRARTQQNRTMNDDRFDGGSAVAG